MSPTAPAPAGRARRAAARRYAGTVVVAAVAATGLTGCTAAPGPSPGTSPQSASPAAPVPPPAGTTTPSAGTREWPAGPALAAVTAQPQDVVTGLVTPWDLAFLPGGAVLVTLRDPAQVVLVTEHGPRTLAGPGAEDLAATTLPRGEGGLLGVAVSPTVAEDRLVHLYRTTAEGNEVVRAPLDPAAGTLGELQPVLTGIPAAGRHDGGRIAFGPDGRLYVATGDAGDRSAAQDPGSLAGKILRVTADGDPAPGNPVPGSAVWSLGHRNVQGLAWDDEGTLLASELGQDGVDELNVVVPGGNYGWPRVEGSGGSADGLLDPVVRWSPDRASPSGAAWLDGTVYVAALRGERLLTVTFPDGVPAAADRAGPGRAVPGEALVGELGRLRHVAVGPDGALWVLTQNTDGRGAPRPGDDRLVRLAPP